MGRERHHGKGYSRNVFLAFDDKCMGDKWEKIKDKYKKLGHADEPGKATFDASKNPDSLNTFSFHPWAVRHDDGSNELGVIIAGTSDVWDNAPFDIAQFRDPSVKRTEVTIAKDKDEKEQQQIKLLEKVIKSWGNNSASAKAKDPDGEYYSFEHYNCGTWAQKMITDSGLPAPSMTMNMGTGLGYGLDNTGIPQGVYGIGTAAALMWGIAKDIKNDISGIFEP